MMLRLIIGIVVVYLLYKLIKGWKAIQGPSGKNIPVTGEDLVEDPTGRTSISAARNVWTSTGGKEKHRTAVRKKYGDGEEIPPL